MARPPSRVNLACGSATAAATRALLCAALFLALTPTLADTPASSPARVATREEYAACLAAQDDIEARRTAFQSLQARIADFEARFKAAEADLAAQVQRHTPSTHKEIASYNRAVEARNASVRKFNAEVEVARTRQDELNGLIVATHARCGSLLISAEVEADVAEERRVRRAGPSGTSPR